VNGPLILKFAIEIHSRSHRTRKDSTPSGANIPALCNGFLKFDHSTSNPLSKLRFWHLSTEKTPVNPMSYPQEIYFRVRFFVATPEPRCKCLFTAAVLRNQSGNANAPVTTGSKRRILDLAFVVTGYWMQVRSCGGESLVTKRRYQQGKCGPDRTLRRRVGSAADFRVCRGGWR